MSAIDAIAAESPKRARFDALVAEAEAAEAATTKAEAAEAAASEAEAAEAATTKAAASEAEAAEAAASEAPAAAEPGPNQTLAEDLKLAIGLLGKKELASLRSDAEYVDEDCTDDAPMARYNIVRAWARHYNKMQVPVWASYVESLRKVAVMDAVLHGGPDAEVKEDQDDQEYAAADDEGSDEE